MYHNCCWWQWWQQPPALRNGNLGGGHTSPSLSGHQRFQGAHGKIQLTQSLTQSRQLLMWSYRVNTSIRKELPCEGYLLETGTGRVEGRSMSRGQWSSRKWIHSNSTGKMQRCCPATAPEHNEEQRSAGSSSLQWDIMENARAGRKEGKQVNYTRK